MSRISKTLLDGLDKFAQRHVWAKVARLTRKLTGQADEVEAAAMAAEAAAPPGTTDVMAQCLAEMAQKYDLVGQFTPEAMFCVAAASWGAGFAGVNKRLDALEARFAEPPEAAKEAA